MTVLDKELGDWICTYCGQSGRHTVNCPAPRGKCGKCGSPLDAHDGTNFSVCPE